MRRQSLRYDDICPRQLTETKKKQLDQETHLQTTIFGGSMFYFQVFSLGCSLTMTCEAANFTEVTVSIGWNHMQSLVSKSCLFWRYHTKETYT